eukprot:6358782-Prymnesium_polylepis.1
MSGGRTVLSSGGAGSSSGGGAPGEWANVLAVDAAHFDEAGVVEVALRKVEQLLAKGGRVAAVTVDEQ